MIRVAHFCRVAPNQCGLYGTAKELIMAERLAGIDAGMIDHDGVNHRGVMIDGSFKSKELSWADDADILVRHSAIPDKYHNSGKPIVMALHGRPESSFRLEESGKSPILTAMHNKGTDARYKAFITFWPEYIDFWRTIIPPEKVQYIPAMVDTNEYNPCNDKFDLGEHKADINILICDIWRDDITPLNSIFGAAQYCRESNLNAKVHIVGISDNISKILNPMLSSLRKEGILGYCGGMTRDIKGFYTAADMVVSPHVIATRSIREARASGCKVVDGKDCNHNDTETLARVIQRDMKTPYQRIDNLPDMKVVGQKAKAVFESIMPKAKTKVMIDLGGHLGETVRRFYREMPDAEEYKIFSFEGDPDTADLLEAKVGHIDGVEIIRCVADTKTGEVNFYRGGVNLNEGGTSVIGKKTGGVDYQKPIRVAGIHFAKWLLMLDADEIILKMNIEGGEYELMKDLAECGALKKLSKCFIQTHAHKFDDPKKFDGIESVFRKKCKRHGVKLFTKKKGFYPFDSE